MQWRKVFESFLLLLKLVSRVLVSFTVAVFLSLFTSVGFRRRLVCVMSTARQFTVRRTNLWANDTSHWGSLSGRSSKHCSLTHETSINHLQLDVSKSDDKTLQRHKTVRLIAIRNLSINKIWLKWTFWNIRVYLMHNPQ